MLYLTIPYFEVPEKLLPAKNKNQVYLKNGGVLRSIISIYLTLLNQWKKNSEFTVKILDGISRIIFLHFKKDYHKNLIKKIIISNMMHKDIFQLKD